MRILFKVTHKFIKITNKIKKTIQWWVHCRWSIPVIKQPPYQTVCTIFTPCLIPYNYHHKNLNSFLWISKVKQTQSILIHFSHKSSNSNTKLTPKSLTKLNSYPIIFILTLVLFNNLKNKVHYLISPIKQGKPPILTSKNHCYLFKVLPKRPKYLQKTNLHHQTQRPT